MTLLTEDEVGKLDLVYKANDRALIVSSHENFRNMLQCAMRLIDELDKELYLIQGYELEQKLPPLNQKAHDFRMKLRKEGFIYENTKIRGSLENKERP